MEIKDSGKRRSFGEGLAVRDDTSPNKGDYSLLCPYAMVSICEAIFDGDKSYGHGAGWNEIDPVLSFPELVELISSLHKYPKGLFKLHVASSASVLLRLLNSVHSDFGKAIHELAVHSYLGAEKYGRHNWTKGIPLSSYIDSCLRHGNMHFRGLKDEPHLVACAWNMMAYLGTVQRIGLGILPESLDNRLVAGVNQ